MTESPSPGSAPTPESRSVFRVSAFRSLLGSTTTSALGAAISSVTVTWLVYHVTGSTLDVTFVGLVSFVPGVVFGFFAGVLADRYNRRRIMVASDLVRATAMAALTLSLYLLGFSLFLVLSVMTLVYTFTALFNPASQAILPRLVDARQLEDANGVLIGSRQLCTSLGAATGGLLIIAFGATAGLGINAATYSISAFFLVHISVDLGKTRSATGAAARSLGKEMVEGFRYLRKNLPILELAFALIPVNFFIAMVIPFLVVYAATVLGPSAALYGYLLAAFAAGVVTGSLTVGRIRARRFAGKMIATATMILSVGMALLVLGHSLPAALLGVFLFGMGGGLVNTTYYSTMQAIIPNELLARALSLALVTGFVAVPAGLVVGGLLITSFGILVPYSLGGVCFLVDGLAMLALPGVRSLSYHG